MFKTPLHKEKLLIAGKGLLRCTDNKTRAFIIHTLMSSNFQSTRLPSPPYSK